jgi:hypothetical protein
MQEVQLALASNEGSESSVDTDLQAATPRTATNNVVHRHWLASSSNLHRPLRFAAHISLNQPICGLGDENRPRLRQALQASRHIGGIAHRSVIHPQVITDAADDHHTGIQAQAQVNLYVALGVELGVIGADRFPHHQRRHDRP